ncbi:MAG: chloride channel protein [Candidatus Brocadiaceae bacterium]|jgi:CIC family chloride channel protein
MDYVRRLFRKLVPPRAETSAVGVTIILAGFVGIGAGLMALLIGWLISFLNRNVFFRIGQAVGVLPEPWHYALILVPPVVFLGVGYALRRLAPEAVGTGISQVMSAVGRGGGYIRRRVIAVKALATAVCIGAGAPLGVEGPVVQTGAAVGSAVGSRFKMGVGNIRILVAAGAAAGLAAKYGAAIGGAVFSAELILGSASTAALLPLIAAAFLAVLTRHAVLGGVPEYYIPAEQFSFTVLDYVLFIALGVLCGIAAVYFIKLLFATEDVMRRLLSRWWAMALVGGLLVGGVGFLRPELLGTGHDVIQRLLERPAFPVKMLLLFILLKPFLCSVALGSRQSGGIFAPSLFTGAALGAVFARLLSDTFGLQVAHSSAYVIVGMAAVMGAVMRAPLQAILVSFELAHNYSVVPPLMIACVISLKVSELFEPESAFTRWLVRKGERLRQGMDFALLEDLTVRDIMHRDYVALPADAGIDEIDQLVQKSENRTFPVTDEEGGLRGIVMLASLIRAGSRAREPGTMPRVADLIEPTAVSLHPGNSLEEAWRTMGNYDYDCLPVCEAGQMGLEIIGICEKEAIVEMHDRRAFVSLSRGKRN